MYPNNHPDANDNAMITINLVKNFLETIVHAKSFGSLCTNVNWLQSA